MAREKSNKENRRDMVVYIRNNAESHGYNASQYQGKLSKIVNNFEYKLSIDVNYAIYINIKYKPIILDKIYIEIFDMLGENVDKSLSFYLNRANGAIPVEIERLALDGNESMETIFLKTINYSNKIIEEHSAKINDIETFYESILKDDSQYLNVILTDILNNNYEKALIKINKCITENKSGGFRSKNGELIIEWVKKDKSGEFIVQNGKIINYTKEEINRGENGKSIIEYAKEYCEKRI
jgi:hypothetical protein